MVTEYNFERPEPLRGSEREQIKQLFDYLCRLVDQLNKMATADDILNNDCGTGVPLRYQFEAIKNILGGG